MGESIKMDGIWKFQLGNEEESPDALLWDSEIRLPGILEAQGFGDEITCETDWVSGLHDPLWYLREEYKAGQENGVKVPFLSQPPRHYQGTAWYQREFFAEGQGIYFFEMEVTRWKTQVWVDGEKIGEITSLCGPHVYELGKLEKGSHTLTVQVDNRFLLPYRPDGHGVSDALGAAWNGMAGELLVYSVPEVYMKHVTVKPDSDTRILTVNIRIGNTLKGQAEGSLTVLVRDCRTGKQKTESLAVSNIPEGDSKVQLSVDLNGISGLWDEFDKNVQEVSASLTTDAGCHEKKLSFGFRKVYTGEGKFYVNDRPSYFRGTHFGGDFPLTGYPSTDPEDWKRIFSVCREWGLNFVRFHSYCPPRAAFLAADELGIYLQVECAMWNVFGQDNGMDQVLLEETKRILEAFGNHPSFLMLSPSNEPGGNWKEPLAGWYCWCKDKEEDYSGQRIYTMQSGWPWPNPPAEITDTDYVYFHRSGYGPYSGGTIRGNAGWAGGDYRASLEGIKYPVITHEMGQWCSYPDFDVKKKFTGYLQPGNFEVYEENARKNKVFKQNKEFVKASGRLQVSMYKEDLEANFRTPHIYGFELLDLHDYLGQGGALVGVLDAFWDNKGYVSPEEFRSFCSETVVLLRISRRVFVEGEELSYPVELCHFGREALGETKVYWKLKNQEGAVLRQGGWVLSEVPLGKNISVGQLTLTLSGEGFETSGSFRIEAGIEGSQVKNSWKLWVYEREIPKAPLTGTVYTKSLKEAKKALEEGRCVVFSPSGAILGWDCPPLSARPAFWNAQMGPRWSRGMGLLCDPAHPALSKFPTEAYQEWQWEDIIRNARGINLKHYPEELKPIVQPIDEWNRNCRMGLIMECMVGTGRLLMLGCDLDQGDSPVKRRLLYSLLSYVESGEFHPKVQVAMEDFLKSFQDTGVMKRLGVSAVLMEDEADLSPALDGDPNTTFMFQRKEGYPYTISLSWKKPEVIRGLIYMPVQNQRNHDGDIREYEIQLKTGTDWVTIQKGEFKTSFEPKEILFDSPCRVNELRFIAKSGFSGERVTRWLSGGFGWRPVTGPWQDNSISLGELSLITAEGALGAEEREQLTYTPGKTATIEIDE